MRELSLRTLLGLKYQFLVEREAAFVISISYYEWLVSCGFYGADKAIYLSPVPEFLENRAIRLTALNTILGLSAPRTRKTQRGLSISLMSNTQKFQI